MTPILRALANNGQLKLLALVLSVFLWALVQTEPRNEETFPAVPIEVVVSDTAWSLSGAAMPATVDLRLGGPAREIIRLAREGTALRIPIESIGSADTVVTLRRDWVDLTGRSGLIVQSVSPATVRLTFELAVTRLVPAAMRIRGELPAYLALASPIGLNPQMVRVRGPVGRVQDLDSVRLRPLDLTEIEASGVFTVEVDTTGLGGTRVIPRTATLGVRVEEKVERILTDLPIQLRSPDPDAQMVVEPTVVQVTLVGAQTLVNRVDPADLTAWVAPELLMDMEPGEERRVALRIEGVPDLVRAIPDRSMVTVRRTAGGGPE